jgi:hypothetical protein
MILKNILAIAMILLISLPIAALSQATEFYVIGITPPVKSACVVPEQTAAETFRVTSNSTGDEILNVYVANVSWVYTDNNITVPADKGFYDLSVTALPPKGTPEGAYTADVYICTIPPNETQIVAKTCLRALYNINVTYSCEMPGVLRIDTKVILSTVIISTIAFLVAILLYRNRKNGLTYLKKRRK